MSAQVDVLAFLDAEIASARGLSADAYYVQQLPKLEAVRAAVAELIAADKAYDYAKTHRIEADNRITSGDRSDDAFRRQASAHHAYDRAVDRRRLALANMGAA